MTEIILYTYRNCKTIYEVVPQHVGPPAEPVCETCQEAFPVADGGDWLTYRIIRSGIEQTE